MGAHRHRPDKGPAIAWLYGIARRQLAHAARKGAVEDRARRRLGMAPLTLTDEALERVEALATADASAQILKEGLEALPPTSARPSSPASSTSRTTPRSPRRARTSESVVRKRVSRGLAGLRSRLEGQ